MCVCLDDKEARIRFYLAGDNETRAREEGEEEEGDEVAAVSRLVEMVDCALVSPESPRRARELGERLHRIKRPNKQCGFPSPQMLPVSYFTG